MSKLNTKIIFVRVLKINDNIITVDKILMAVLINKCSFDYIRLMSSKRDIVEIGIKFRINSNLSCL